MRRREFLAIVAAPMIIGTNYKVFAQDSSSISSEIGIIGNIPPLPEDLIGQESLPPFLYTPIELRGSAPPSQREKQIAYEILEAAPYDASPIDVAQYFLAVGSGAYGSDLRPFVREWPIRANPVIYHFFSSTLTKPEGDTTAWCAAFLNWCLLRGRAKSADTIGVSPGDYSIKGKPFLNEHISKYSTNSASSGSFRCWDTSPNPKRGDIVVFKNAGTDGLTSSCRGTGHVAFYLGVPKQDKIRVLGGNQTQAGSGGAVTVADFDSGSGSRFMKIVSVR